MNTIVSEIMSTEVTSIPADSSIDEAEQKLREQNKRCAPVVDINGKCFGVLSSRDLLELHEARQNPKAVFAWEICTPVVLSVSPASHISHARDIMVKNAIHHILVLEDSYVEGIVSVIDILKAFAWVESKSPELAF